jgi:uncharacterized protein (DUF362 family)
MRQDTSTIPFTDIRCLFDEGNTRDLFELAAIYSKHDLLLGAIQELTCCELTYSTVSGKRVLLKPNWVKHSLVPSDQVALCTHENFTLAVLDLVLSLQPSRVVLGDAPIQGCNWERLLTPEFTAKIRAKSERYGIPVSIKDFRRVVFDIEENSLTQVKDNLDEFIVFDVGPRSFLEPVTHPTENQFRVTVYNPDRFKESHRPGVHKYCITRELFEADIVISLPKVKTHQKAGITAALKNLVGINGDKDFLPHHRLGGTGRGGDCYPGDSRLRYLSELCYDQGNRHRGRWQYKFWTRIGSALWRLSFPGEVHQVAAGWYGNDTTWRMVMDLNMIINYGTKEGSLAETPQRTLYSLCDGVIGGQGNGPLEPEPLNLGIITFSNNSALNDICCAKLMGMEVGRIPLLVAAAKTFLRSKYQIRLNGRKIDLEELEPYSITAKMPPGWLNYRELAPLADYGQLMDSATRTV